MFTFSLKYVCSSSSSDLIHDFTFHFFGLFHFWELFVFCQGFHLQGCKSPSMYWNLGTVDIDLGQFQALRRFVWVLSGILGIFWYS